MVVLFSDKVMLGNANKKKPKPFCSWYFVLAVGIRTIFETDAAKECRLATILCRSACTSNIYY